MTAMPTVAPLPVIDPSSAYETRPGTTASSAWRTVVPVVTAPRHALPGHRPAAALVADVVAGLAAQRDARDILGERQRAAFVLQHDERRRHGPPGHRAVRGRADLRGQRPVDELLAAVEQAHLALDDQDAPGGVVDARLRHRVGDEGLIIDQELRRRSSRRS